MANVKKSTPGAVEEQPTHGGSYTRNEDGSLTRNEWTEHRSADETPAPPETVVYPSDDTSKE